MEFELHKKCRYDVTKEDEYKKHLTEYLQHLSDIDFSKATPHLKYFGLSFFHDAIVKSPCWASMSHSLELLLFSPNTLEDINELRRRNGIGEIAWKTFVKDPVLHRCTFSHVPSPVLNTGSRQEYAIMDSELGFNTENGPYQVAISFSKEEELQFACKGCTVKVHRPQLLMEYTGGKT